MEFCSGSVSLFHKRRHATTAAFRSTSGTIILNSAHVFSGFWSTILEYFLFGTCSFKEIKVYTFFSLVTSKPSFGLKEYHTVLQAWPKAPSQANKSDAPRYG